MQQESTADEILALIVVAATVLFLVALWITPVVLGIRLAQKKGYSPHWMWFGLHPVGAWVTFIVMACLDKRLKCPNCGGFIASNFRICPYCSETLPHAVYKHVEQQLLE
jgi:hypothetical protein